MKTRKKTTLREPMDLDEFRRAQLNAMKDGKGYAIVTQGNVKRAKCPFWVEIVTPAETEHKVHAQAVMSHRFIAAKFSSAWAALHYAHRCNLEYSGDVL